MANRNTTPTSSTTLRRRSRLSPSASGPWKQLHHADLRPLPALLECHPIRLFHLSNEVVLLRRGPAAAGLETFMASPEQRESTGASTSPPPSPSRAWCGQGPQATSERLVVAWLGRLKRSSRPVDELVRMASPGFCKSSPGRQQGRPAGRRTAPWAHAPATMSPTMPERKGPQATHLQLLKCGRSRGCQPPEPERPRCRQGRDALMGNVYMHPFGATDPALAQQSPVNRSSKSAGTPHVTLTEYAERAKKLTRLRWRPLKAARKAWLQLRLLRRMHSPAWRSSSRCATGGRRNGAAGPKRKAKTPGPGDASTAVVPGGRANLRARAPR